MCCARILRQAFLTAVLCTGIPKALAGTIQYSFTTIPPVPGSQVTHVTGVNDSDQIVGYYSYPQNFRTYFSFVGTIAGGYTTLNPPGASISEATGISNNGLIVGDDLQPRVVLNYLYDNGTFTTIAYPGNGGNEARGVNDNGQFVALLQFPGDPIVDGSIYSNGGFTTLDYPGALGTYLWGINDSGQIVGSVVLGNGQQGALLYNDGSFSMFNDPSDQSGSSFATGINDSGQIVGNYFGPDGHEHGFLDSGGNFTTIDEPGAIDTELIAINDNGQILGSGVGNFLATPLVTPVPEPDSLPLLAVLLVGLGSRGRRTRRRGASAFS